MEALLRDSSFKFIDDINTSQKETLADAMLKAFKLAYPALKKAGDTKTKIEVYPDTPHAFNADYRPSYRAEAAKDGWSRMLAWFRANGVS